MYDLYGKNDQIRKATTQLARVAILQKGKYPMMCRRHSTEQINLLDIPNRDGMKLKDWIHKNGQGYTETEDVFRYMIRNYLCYYETPYTRYDKQKNRVLSYQKKVITANPEIIAEWTGIDLEEVEKKYKLKFDNYINTDAEHKPIAPYLELKVGKDGEHKITKPRKDIDLTDKEMTITPLYLVNESLNCLRKLMEKDCVDINFSKDTHIPRTITTTMNHAYLKEVYGDKTSWVLDVKAKEYSQVDLLKSETFLRGYVRFAEVGGSRYDSATRSVNFARINHFSINKNPDLSVIDVDLSTVVQAFVNATKESNEVVPFVRNNFKKYGMHNDTNLAIWAEECVKKYSTEFKKDLASFMLKNKSIFKNFTGEPIKTPTVVVGMNIETDGNCEVDLTDYFSFE